MLVEYKPESTFPRVIGRMVGESSPAWPALLRAIEGAPNVLFIVLDDTGFGQLGWYELFNQANGMVDQYLIFTIIYACALFFAGISGKFKWQAIDVTVLVMAGLALLIGLGVMVTIPVA